MNFLKKLTGVFVFVAAIAGAVLVSRYFSAPPPEVTREAPRLPVIPADPRLAPDPPPHPASAAEAPPVSSRARHVTLDFTTKKSHLTLELERDRSLRPAPPRVWAWVAFFPPGGGEGGRCEAGPVEVRQPFAHGDRVTVVVEADASGCEAPRGAAATLYARVHVSSVSAEAARLEGASISSEDLTKATPVVIAGARRGGN